MSNQEMTLKEQIVDLKKKLATCEKIRDVLMERVERAVDTTGGAFSLFENNILLENRVRERTEELRQVNEKLMQEIAERKKAEVELAKSRDEAIRLAKVKSLFLANMSHELRTPLNSIIGFSEVLLDQTFGSLNEKQTKYTNNIHASGKHLLALINDILDLSKIEAGKIELKLEDVSIKELLDECHTLVKTMASKKSLLLDFMVEGISTVTADPVRLKQIMYNLLSNAIKFTPDNGKVSVEAKIVNGMVQISVRDTGIGIAKEDMGKVFEEFRQIDSSYAKRYQGTGLGLPLTRKLVELHGGKIWLESEPGKGSIFTFTIPQSGERRNFDTEDTKNTEDILITNGKPVILVVEDEKQTRDLLTIYLEEAGYQVAYAIDGEEAIIKAKEIRPYAITLDIILPKKDGFVVLKELKTIPETKDIPVTIISVVDNKELGLSLGAAEYLMKPVDKKELARKLEKYSLKEKKEGINILLIDDSPEDVELLTSFLEPEGIKVIKAYGGEGGIKLAIEKQPNVIILDLMMPEVSGFEVVQRLKKDERTKNIPIIICTGKDLTEEEKDLLSSNIVSIIEKGKCSKEEFLKGLEKIGRL